MEKEELKSWFLNKLYNCYPITQNNIIYWIYDESYIRRMKLSNINGTEFKPPSKFKGNCLFDQDIKNKILYCNHNHVWLFFEKNHKFNYNEIQSIISEFLECDNKLNTYTPHRASGKRTS